MYRLNPICSRQYSVSEDEGEGEVGIAAATCAQGNRFTPDAVADVNRLVSNGWGSHHVRVVPLRIERAHGRSDVHRASGGPVSKEGAGGSTSLLLAACAL